jgi:uncharacterized protein (AIM24 family)
MNDKNYNILDEKEADNAVIQVLQYKDLKGSSDVMTAERLYYAHESGMSLKMVRVILNNSSLRVEPGALYFMEGDLEMKSTTGGGLLKGLGRKMLSDETFFVNEIHGTGQIYLEPTYGHFLLHEVVDTAEGELIVDKGSFYAGTEVLDISTRSQKNISSALLGGEGFFQTHIMGRGIAILYSPVPVQEIHEVTLNKSKLSVDGNFALMRTGGVTFSVEKSSKSWVSTSVSGEGLLQTFKGTGTVWVAPTQGVYEKLTTDKGIKRLSSPMKSMGTNTKNSTGKR